MDKTLVIVFLAASDISSLSYQLLFTSAELFFLFVFLHWVPGTCSFLGAPFLQRRCFWGGYHSFLSVIDSTFGLKGNFFGNEQLTLMQNIILESQ